MSTLTTTQKAYELEYLNDRLMELKIESKEHEKESKVWLKEWKKGYLIAQYNMMKCLDRQDQCLIKSREVQQLIINLTT